jgi:hypothetical protein
MKDRTPLKLGITASGLDGREVVGTADMYFIGTITVKNGSYKVRGTATFTDSYDFNKTWGTKKEHRPWYTEFPTWGAAFGGWVYSTPPILEASDYQNQFEGSIIVDVSGDL